MSETAPLVWIGAAAIVAAVLQLRRAWNLPRRSAMANGLGWALMQRLIEVSKRIGLKQMIGQVLRDNTSMLAMCRQLGFAIRPDPEDAGIALVELPVN